MIPLCVLPHCVRAGKTMPAVARHLKAVGNSGDSAEEQRLLFKFKSFLYKTVKIG